MHYLPPVLQLLLVAVVVAAGLNDVRTRRIPNWLTVTGFFVGIVLNTLLYETPGLWMAVKGAGLALLIYFPLFAIRAMGAGDAKLMAAVGAIVGPANWVGVFVLTAVVGSVFGLAVIVVTRRVRRTAANVGFLLMQLVYLKIPYLVNPELDVRSPKAFGLPHGAMIALGASAFLGAAAIWAPR
jgi:prepilin peptidase CpaA